MENNNNEVNRRVSADKFIEGRGAEVEAVYNLSTFLNTGLDRRSLAILLELMEMGVHPESLADCKNFEGCCAAFIHRLNALFYFACCVRSNAVVEELRSN